jgi:predicted nucleic acid-binding protein
MRIVINDSSCLIDLRKGGLLESALALPYRFLVTYVVRHSELLDIGPALGLTVIDPPGSQVAQAQAKMLLHRRLSFEDCLNLVAAREENMAILLTGDRALRTIAENEGIEVHGVLWIVTQLEIERVAATADLRAALETWRQDPTVFLPIELVEKALKSLPKK